jgi:hypothetical protein
MKKLSALVALLGFAILAHGQTTFNIAFGVLTNADDSTPAAQGSLVQFIAAPTVGGLVAPTPTAFVSGTELLLSTISLDDTTNGNIPGSMFTSVTVTVPQNYALMLQWFPTLSSAASAPGGSTPYGQYSLINDASWVAPTPGSTISLNLLTTTVFGPNSTPDSAGYANLTTAPIPEPATYAALFGVMALGFAAYRRRLQAV